MSRWWLCLVMSGCLGIASDLSQCAAADPFVFRDTTKEAGLETELLGMKGHAAGWGDANNDGWIDLYVGAFAENDSKFNKFFISDKGNFKLDTQPALSFPCRPTGALFADLDNDGDLDLYVSCMPKVPKPPVVKPAKPKKNGDKAPTKPVPPPKPAYAVHLMVPCQLFRNDGGGKYTNISEGNGACPTEFGGRSVTVLDFDGDGLLDLLVGEEPLSGKDGVPGYNGSTTHSSRLFRNKGKLQFEDVTQSVGIAEGIPGLGVAAIDANNDTYPDLFIAGFSPSNKLYLNDGHGRFNASAEVDKVFTWPQPKVDDYICGIAFGDVNRDGLMDAVIGQHLSYPRPDFIADRLYINRGMKNGVPRYEDVTEKAGLVPLPMKGPHVEMQDYDNDGWMDISVSIAKFANGKTYPLIFRNLGNQGAIPQFKEYCLGVNDYPNADDLSGKGTGAFFDKMIAGHKIIYTAPGPSGDYDNDGRLDIFMPNWWMEAPSLLLHNETPGGNWVDVTVQPPAGVNRMGIGSRVNIYPAGKLSQAKELLGAKEIATGYGYASGQPAIAHFGLGKLDKVDIEVILPNKKGKIVKRDVAANQRLTVGPE